MLTVLENLHLQLDAQLVCVVWWQFRYLFDYSDPIYSTCRPTCYVFIEQQYWRWVQAERCISLVVSNQARVIRIRRWHSTYRNQYTSVSQLTIDIEKKNAFGLWSKTNRVISPFIARLRKLPAAGRLIKGNTHQKLFLLHVCQLDCWWIFLVFHLLCK